MNLIYTLTKLSMERIAVNNRILILLVFCLGFQLEGSSQIKQHQLIIKKVIVATAIIDELILKIQSLSFLKVSIEMLRKVLENGNLMVNYSMMRFSKKNILY